MKCLFQNIPCCKWTFCCCCPEQIRRNSVGQNVFSALRHLLNVEYSEYLWMICFDECTEFLRKDLYRFLTATVSTLATLTSCCAHKENRTNERTPSTQFSLYVLRQLLFTYFQEPIADIAFFSVLVKYWLSSSLEFSTFSYLLSSSKTIWLSNAWNRLFNFRRRSTIRDNIQ